ncbi:AAA family ATPase [Streptomyces sp. NPDC012888]|uniref:helix-turn-helix transcriptional regulator n=1 Tax=Streptomyces sp. NPDC012888 TaxID=3364855 RepID=UPI00368FC81F
MQLARQEAGLGLLEELLQAARRGTGRAALVTGSPGTGRSTLLRAFARRAAGHGSLVLTASASRAETDLPLGVVGQLLSCAGLPAATVPRTEDGRPDVLLDALRDHAAAAPVVVLVDDVQYADEPSVRCLLYLCGRLAGVPVLLVLSGPARQAPGTTPSPALAELLRHPRCAALPLAPWDEETVGAFLVDPSAGGMDPAPAARLAPGWWHFTGGNPRLLRGLLEDHRACEPVRPSRPVAGTAFRRAVTACLHGAGEAATSVARALAVLGDDTTLTLLARLLEVPERAVAACLDALDSTGLLVGGRLRHEGVRAAVLEELTAADAAGLHAAAARVLYENGAEPAAVARQLVDADTAGGLGAGDSAWAVPLLAEAARQALGGGSARRAADFLRTAHRAAGPEAPGPGLPALLAGAEWEADPAAVLRHLPALERALDGAPPDPDPELAGCLGLLLWHGRPGAAARAVAAGPAAGPGEPAGAPRGGGPAAALVYAYPEAAGPVPGRPAEPDDDAAERVWESLVFGHAPAVPVAAVLSALLRAGETPRAARWRELLDGVGRAPVTPARRAVAAAAAAVVHARTGSYERAAGEADRALGLLSPAAWGVALGVPLSAAVLAATRLGAHGKAEELLRVPVPPAMFRTRAGLHYLLARGHHHLAVGRPGAALGDFHACRDLLAGWGLEAGGAFDWAGGAAEAARAAHGGGSGHRHGCGDPVAALSRAERRVAALAAGGCTNRAIAARLFLTTSTVEQHLTRVYRKLGMKSRVELAALAGLTAPPG